MKKLIFIITGLLLLFSVEGQILRYSNYTAPDLGVYEYMFVPFLNGFGKVGTKFGKYKGKFVGPKQL